MGPRWGHCVQPCCRVESRVRSRRPSDNRDECGSIPGKPLNASLDPHEQLKCLVVASAAWTVENDIVTPTFKVKRNRIEDIYSANYARWEDSGQMVIWQSG